MKNKKLYSAPRFFSRGFYVKSIFTFLILNIYVLSQLFIGQNGITQHKRIQMYYEKVSYKLNSLEQKNKKLEHEINLLAGDCIDIDYLDEVARKTLNYSNKDERVILLQ